MSRPLDHGITGYGGYVPRLRMERAAIAAAHKWMVACDDQPQRLKSLRPRFSSPVYPGETLATDWWRDATCAAFARV